MIFKDFFVLFHGNSNKFNIFIAVAYEDLDYVQSRTTFESGAYHTLHLARFWMVCHFSREFFFSMRPRVFILFFFEKPKKGVVF